MLPVIFLAGRSPWVHSSLHPLTDDNPAGRLFPRTTKKSKKVLSRRRRLCAGTDDSRFRPKGVPITDIRDMSALGQKQTYAVQKPMSALPPIATTKADIARKHGYALFSRHSAGMARTCRWRRYSVVFCRCKFSRSGCEKIWDVMQLAAARVQLGSRSAPLTFVSKITQAQKRGLPTTDWGRRLQRRAQSNDGPFDSLLDRMVVYSVSKLPLSACLKDAPEAPPDSIVPCVVALDRLPVLLRPAAQTTALEQSRSTYFGF